MRWDRFALACTMALLLSFSGSLVAGAASTEPGDEGSSTGPIPPSLVWERIETMLPRGRDRQCPPSLQAVASRTAGDFVVVASDLLGCGDGATAWYSADGVGWERDALKGSGASAAVGHDQGFIVVGDVMTRRGRDGLVWTTSGDGVWSEIRFKDARLTDIMRTPEGFDLYGMTDLKQGYGFPAVWRSVDGSTWDGPSTLSDRRAGFVQAAGSPTGIRLVLDRAEGGTLWRSEDGSTWEGLELPSGDGEGSMRYGPIAWTPGGFVIAVERSTRGSFSNELWLSTDGFTWIPVAAPTGSIAAFLTDESGTRAFQAPPTDRRGRYRDSPTAIHWSRDGLTWCTSTNETLAGVGLADVATAPSGRVLAVGSTHASILDGSPVLFAGRPAGFGEPPTCEPTSIESLDPTALTLSQPVVETPSTVAACSSSLASPDGAAATDVGSGATDSEGQAAVETVTTYCARDLLAAGATKVKPSQALKSTHRSFQRGPCVRPAGEAGPDRALLCLHEIASAWRDSQRETNADGRVSKDGLDEVLPMYQWASSMLSRTERAYLDAGMSRLDVIPLGWVREAPTDLKDRSVVRSSRQSRVSLRALHRRLQQAWLESDLVPIPDATIEMPGGWESPDLPMGYSSQVATPLHGLSLFVGPRGGLVPLTTVISACELAVDPRKTPNVSGSIRTETCGRAAASTWLAYLATGDDRFIDVAIGIRDVALQASSTEGLRSGTASKERLFFETFECWLTEDSHGCYTGL
jgi:hypothetical protein